MAKVRLTSGLYTYAEANIHEYINETSTVKNSNKRVQKLGPGRGILGIFLGSFLFV